MSEIAETGLLRQLAQELHARFVIHDGFAVAQGYGDEESEYDALRTSAGIVDLTYFKFLRVQGDDRVAWLHKLVTADIQALGELASCQALLLNATGHVAADFTSLRLAGSLLLYTGPSAFESLAAGLKRALFRERVSVTPDDSLALLSLQGPEAIEVLGRTLGTYFVPQDGRAASAKFFDSELLVVGSARVQDGGLDLLVERRHAEILWKMLAEKGARPVGQAALNVARVEAGIPWFGDDFDATMLAPEARLDALIAENKGCYTGQEVIARIKNRGHVNRLLVRFAIDGETTPDRGDLVLDEAEVGWITSPVWSFERQTPLAFGYLRREKADAGTRLRVAHGDAMLEATVI